MFILQTLNVLIAGDGEFAPLIKKSKYLKKLYITSEKQIEDTINIRFNTFKELAKKCKSLQIDIVFVENKKWVLQGIADVLRNSFVNCIALNAYWASVLTDSMLSRILLEKYKINIPQKLQYPKEFPLLIRGKGFKYKANSLDEILKIKQLINAKYPQAIANTTFLEEFLEGEVINVCSFFDGKSLKTFSKEKNILEYSNLLQNVLISEKATFLGLFNSRLIQCNGVLYNTGFSIDFPAEKFDKDFLFILYCGIYQKLNELN